MTSVNKVRSQRHLEQTKRGGGEVGEDEGEEEEEARTSGDDDEEERSECRSDERGGDSDDDASKCSTQALPIFFCLVTLIRRYHASLWLRLRSEKEGRGPGGRDDSCSSAFLPATFSLWEGTIEGGEKKKSSHLFFSMDSAASDNSQYVAAVVGSTGSTGDALVAALSNSPRFSKVVAIARRSPTLASTSTKIEEKKLDLDQLAKAATTSPSTSTSSSNPLQGVDAVFVALGTTRAAAGSASEFWKVDVTGVESTASLSAAANVPLFSLVSASGAARNGWKPTLSFLHPLYYASAKGAAEEAAITRSKCASVFIYRPGLLDRGAEKQRLGEKWAIKVGFPSLKVETLAAVMVADAVAELDKVKAKGSAPSGEVHEVVKGDGEIKRDAAALFR